MSAIAIYQLIDFKESNSLQAGYILKLLPVNEGFGTIIKYQFKMLVFSVRPQCFLIYHKCLSIAGRFLFAQRKKTVISTSSLLASKRIVSWILKQWKTYPSLPKKT